MKQRLSWKLAVLCAVTGVVVAFGGWYLPVHFRAIDVHLLRAASVQGQALHEAALELVRQNHVGAAELLREAAERQKLPNSGNLDQWMVNQTPDLPMTDVFIRGRAREQELALLEGSQIPAVRALLQTRALNNTKDFAPSSSAAGQAFDTAVAIAGCLINQGSVSGPFRDTITAAATAANKGESTEPLERILLDFLSLGQRFDRDQAGVFVSNIQDGETFSMLTEEARNAGPTSLPMLYAAVELSGQPRAVATYVRDFNDTGMHDVAASLRYGSGGLMELLRRQERLYGNLEAGDNEITPRIDKFCLTEPGIAMTLKCLLYLLAGFFLAEAAHYARPIPSYRERPLEVRGVHYARASLFALGFLVVALMLSEPFLGQQSQKMEIRLRLPTVGMQVPAGAAPAKPLAIMNSSNTTLLTLLLFFVLQALLYISCLVKLAEIKRQNTVTRVKLKLLENEEHLFDAGLYLGFCGTIVSLILASLGITGWSLMAAYSSTSFGIIFVSIFKIFHLRPVRRDLLLQSEGAGLGEEPETLRPSLATLP